jgi:hypothetical protein
MFEDPLHSCNQHAIDDRRGRSTQGPAEHSGPCNGDHACDALVVRSVCGESLNALVLHQTYPR